MITMLQYDALQNPAQQNRKGSSNSLIQAQAYLEQHPYVNFEKEELAAVRYFLFYCEIIMLLNFNKHFM